MALHKPNPFQWTVNALTNNSVSTGINGTYVTNAMSTMSADAALTVKQGRMSVTVPLDVNGIDVEQVLKDLMTVTGVVNRNRNLESQFKGLREAGETYQKTLQTVQANVHLKFKQAADDYRFAEEKYKTFNSIKDSK